MGMSQIRSPLLVAVGCGMALITEVLLRVSSSYRDGLFYKGFFAKSVGTTGLDPLTVQKLPRNSCLRINNSAYENMSEFVCIWNACVMVILWDLGGNSNSTREERILRALISALIQTS